MLRKRKLIIGGSTAGAGSLAIILLFAWPGLVQTTEAVDINSVPEVDEPEVTDNWEEQTKIEEQQELAANEKVLADPEIARAIAGAYSYQVDFNLEKDNTNSVIVKVVGKESVEGTYETGYTQTYSGLKTFKLQVDESNNAIVDRVSFNQANKVYPGIIYSADKPVIKAALENEDVKNALTGLKDGEDYYISVTHYVDYNKSSGIDCPHGSCASIYVILENTKQVMTIDMNTVTGQIVFMATSDDWRTTK